MNAFAHGALEGWIRPCADAGFRIRGYIGAVDNAERGLERPAARVDDPVDLGMATGAVTQRGELLALGNGCCRIGRWVRSYDRRDRAPGQSCCGAADDSGACSGNTGNNAAALKKRIPRFLKRLLRRSACVWQGFRLWRFSAVQARKNALGRQWKFAEADAGCIEDRICNSCSARHRRGFANAERWLILTRQHQHVDFWNIRKFDDRVGAPFAARNRRTVERDFFHQGAAGGLNDVAVNLVTHTLRVDHLPGILPGNDTGHADVTGRFVDGNVRNPRGPRGRLAGKRSMHIQGIGEATSANDIAFGLRLLPDRTRGPIGALGDGLDQIDSARVFQVPEPVFDRIDASLRCQFVDVGLMGECIGKCRHAAKPRRPYNRRHVVRDHAHSLVVVGWDRGAIAHLKDRRYRCDSACKQQCQCRCAVRRIARREVIGCDAAVSIQAAVDIHQLRRALGLPCMLLFARQLHAHGAAHGAGQQDSVGGHIIGAVAPIATGRLQSHDIDLRFRKRKEQREIASENVRILRAGPHAH